MKRDGTAEPISRAQSRRRERGPGKKHLFLVQLTTRRIGNLARSIETLLHVMTIHTFRALSLLNLVSGYEFRRIVPAGVGPGSPSRDAAN